MLRPLWFVSCVCIATLSLTAMVFEWPSKMVLHSHLVVVLLRSDQGPQTHGNDKRCPRFLLPTYKRLGGLVDVFFHNFVARFLHMLYTLVGMINVSQAHDIFSIAHSHTYFLWQAMIWVGEKPCPNMDRIHPLICLDSLAPSSECTKLAKELPWQGCPALLRWLISWYWTLHKVLSIYSCFATKLHWHPHLEVRPACNLLALLCFVCLIGSGHPIRLLGQLVSESEAVETTGTTKGGTRGVFVLFRFSTVLASRAVCFTESLSAFLFCFSTRFLASFWFVDSYDFKALANILSTSLFASLVLSIGPYSQCNLLHKS